MNSKKVLAAVILGLFVVGVLSMMGFGSRGSQTNSSQQREETSDEMVGRMHPIEQSDNDNSGMDTIKFSEVIGEVAPSFTLTNQDGSKFTLSDHNDKTVVLFFSGGAMCYPACWDQIADLSEDERFNNDDVLAVSIVVDGKEKWDQIISSQPKYGAGTLLFDPDRTVSKAYDMLNTPSSMHKGSFPGHTYLIIKDGVIAYMLDDPKMALNTDEIASNL